jgi:hypothetical protein
MGQREAGNGGVFLHGRAAAERLEPHITNDLRLGVDLDMKAHNITALCKSIVSFRYSLWRGRRATYSRRADQSFANGLVRLV